MSEERKFCMCCGEDVPVTTVERDGHTEITCVFCGFTLDLGLPETEAEGGGSAVPCVIAVDDADSHRSVLQKLLETSGLAEEVVALHGGTELVDTITRRFAEDLPVSLVILDVEMPVLDGFASARYLRALEQKLKRKPCPIIFFTSRQADANLRRQMALYRPSWYCAKGADASPAAFERRVTALIGHVTSMFAAEPDAGS